MIPISYEDKDTMVVQRSAGLGFQVFRGFTPDMVSEIRRYLHNPRDIHSHPQGASTIQPFYVGVIHKLDKPVEGIMVYELDQKSTASLGASLQAGKVEKSYLAVACGKPVDKQGIYMDYLYRYKKNSISKIVDKSDENDREAALNYWVLEAVNNPGKWDQILSLINTELPTGGHHQIGVQFVGHATPLYGDGRYGGELSTKFIAGTVDRTRKKTGFGDERRPLALYAHRLAFPRPSDEKRMEFATAPSSGALA